MIPPRGSSPRPWLRLGVLLAVTATAWAQCIWGPSFNRDNRWIEHILAFAAWTPCLAAWLASGTRLRPVVVWAAAAGVSAAALGEALQFAMPNHTPEWWGIGWSTVGVTIGLLGWVAWCRRTPRP